MKVSTCCVVFVAAMVLSGSGCRYDKVNNGGSVDDSDAMANGAALATETDGIGVDADSGSLADLNTAGKSFRDRGYKVCTDVAFAPVYFGFDATNLRPDELAKIEAVVAHLRANPDRVVSIEGNCDERGSNEYNLSLGDDRALIICNYMAQNGIDRARMETVSRGETNPAVAGSGEAAWSLNRRGEFVILAK